MALWLARCGRHGQFESKYLDDCRIYLTWSNLKDDIRGLKTKAELREYLLPSYPDASVAKVSNHLGQIWAFVQKMEPGDWVVVPSKRQPAVHIAEITGPCEFVNTLEPVLKHSRSVKWIATDVPRSNFAQDILYSLGAIMTICKIERNDAEARVRRMATQGWRESGILPTPVTPTLDDDSEEAVGDGVPSDLEEVAKDQIARQILARYKGHGMARLVDAILKAQGYETHVSPEGPDKGVDLLAAPGSLGFGEPRLCVQVKSGDAPLDRPTLDQLIGTMQNFHASHGLLVSWGGFKSTVDKEKAAQFFRVRLWDRDDLIDQLFEHYEHLGDELRAELPLKRIWTVATTEVGDDGE